MTDPFDVPDRPAASRPLPPPGPRPARGVLALLTALACGLAAALPATLAHAQISTSYVDDSVLARESLSRVEDLLSAGNVQEAARVVQAILDTETDRVIEAAGDADLFINVRTAVHLALIARPALLDKYRQSEEPVAEAQLREGRIEEVERSRLLTRSGMEAALRLAYQHYEAARFEAAALTLVQLEKHPDRLDPALGKAAVDLAFRIAAYLPRESIVALARRWAAEARIDLPVMEPKPWPPRWQESLGRDSVGAGPAPAFDGLVEGPLQSTFLSGDAAAEYRAFQELPRDDNFAAGLYAWAFPTVVGDDVLVNDGRAITAFDRFTLSTRWRKEFSEAGEDSIGAAGDGIRALAGSSRVEDASTVAAAEGVAVAATGLQSQQMREGDNRLHGVELSTGRELWALAPGAIAENLRIADFRGPAAIDQSTVVQAFRKESAARRLVSTYLAGVDLWTGATRWVRLIGSAGSIGYAGTRPGETLVTHEGVVYRIDDSGLVCAVESVSGRIRWIRLLKGENVLRANDSSPPWASQAPIIDGDSLIVLDPTQRFIHRLSLADGARLTLLETSNLPRPIHYLLAAGAAPQRTLVVVTDNQLAFLPMASFHTARASLVPAINDPGFRGRVVVMADTVVAPVTGGLLLAKITAPASPQVKPLEFTGNFVASGSNLLIADTWRLHAFLSWADADTLLSARMKADPADPRPALALAELAYRSQHLDRLVPAIDHALAAMAAQPLSPVVLQARPRLFGTLLDMIRFSTQPEQPTTRLASKPLRLTDLALVDALVSRLERVSESPTENVQWLMALGALRELQSNPSEACGAYQRILEDPKLADSAWRQVSPAVRSRQIAIDRLRSVIGVFGPSAYARFSAELDGELAALRSASRPEELEALAARYPVAPRSTELLLSAAAGYRAAGQNPAALLALAKAADTAWWLVSVGTPADQARLGEVVGAHAQALADLGRPMTAAQVLLRAVKTKPGLAVTAFGTPLNPTARAAELRQLAVVDARPARIGSVPAPDLSVLIGWSILPPVLDNQLAPALSHEWTILSSMQLRRFGSFADQGGGVLSPVWSRPFQDEPPTVLHAGPDALFVLWHDNTSIERIDPATGETIWRSAALVQLLPPAPAAGVRMFETPLDGQVRSIDIVAAINDKSVVLAQRDGGVVAFDASSGQLAWSARSPLTRLYDLSLTGATLVLSGAADPDDNAEIGPLDRREVRTPPKPLIVVLDAASGRNLYDPIVPDSDVRWVRTAPGVLVAALVDKVRGIELATGKPLWEDLVGEEVTHAAEGWIFDDRLFLLSRRRELSMVSLRTGLLQAVDLKNVNRLPDTGQIVAGRIGPNIAFSSRLGVFMINPQGNLAGANSVGGHRPFLPAVASKDVLVMVEQSTDELPDGRTSIRAMLVTADSGKVLRTLAVVVQGEPDTITTAVLDGKLLLSTDSVTQVIPLPETQPKSAVR